jgi:hypothetical protein
VTNDFDDEGDVMKKATKSVKEKPTEANAIKKQRGFGIVELLFAATTLGSTVLVAAMSVTKKPPLSGD